MLRLHVDFDTLLIGAPKSRNQQTSLTKATKKDCIKTKMRYISYRLN